VLKRGRHFGFEQEQEACERGFGAYIVLTVEDLAMYGHQPSFYVLSIL
jgi:hypothetical protein